MGVNFRSPTWFLSTALYTTILLHLKNTLGVSSAAIKCDQSVDMSRQGKNYGMWSPGAWLETIHQVLLGHKGLERREETTRLPAAWLAILVGQIDLSQRTHVKRKFCFKWYGPNLTPFFSASVWSIVSPLWLINKLSNNFTLGIIYLSFVIWNLKLVSFLWLLPTSPAMHLGVAEGWGWLTQWRVLSGPPWPSNLKCPIVPDRWVWAASGELLISGISHLHSYNNMKVATIYVSGGQFTDVLIL